MTMTTPELNNVWSLHSRVSKDVFFESDIDFYFLPIFLHCSKSSLNEVIHDQIICEGYSEMVES